jgi:Fe-S oxidoreductase
MWNEDKCDKCGDCLVKCQYVDYEREKAIAQIETLIGGRNAEILSACLTCCACNEYCSKGANPFDLINALQEKYKTLLVPDKVIAWMDAGEKVPSKLIRGSDKKRALSLCVMESMAPKDSLGGNLFKGMTVVKGGDYFCFLGYVHIGQPRALEENAKRFIDNLAAAGTREVVFIHDDCYAMMQKMPEFGLEVPFKAIHIVEYLRDYLKAYPDEIRPMGLKVAYQRPCASRFTDGLDLMLDEIFESIGVERVNRAYDRRSSLCCGSIFAKICPERIETIQKKNIDDAVKAGAEAMVFLCPLCMNGLGRRAREHNMAPIFITQLVRMGLGELPVPHRRAESNY